MKSKSLSIIICISLVLCGSLFAQTNSEQDKRTPEQRLTNLIVNYVDWENDVYHALYNGKTPKNKRDGDDEEWCKVVQELEAYMIKKYSKKLNTPDLKLARLVVMEDWKFSGSYHKIYFVYPKKGTLKMAKSGQPVDWTKHSVNLMCHRMSPTRHYWGRLGMSGAKTIAKNRNVFIKAFKEDIDFHFTEPTQFDLKIIKYEKIEKQKK